MDLHRQHQCQRKNDPSPQPTTCNAFLSNQEPPSKVEAPGFAVVAASMENGNGKSLPKRTSSFSSASIASLEEFDPPNHVFAIPISVEPVEQETIDDFDFFEYLHQLFAQEESEGLHPQQLNSNLQYLMDPTAWLSSENLLYSSEVAAPLMTIDETLNTHPSVHHTRASNEKLPPIKAAAGKVKPASASIYHRQLMTNNSSPKIAPLDFLQHILTERGYSFASVKSSDAGYMTFPSPLQLASFGVTLVDAVHTSNVELLSSLLECGLSPNPCNRFRDFPLAWACKKAQDSVFFCFLNHHADVRVCDGFGRTPLHHTAWADTFSPTIAAAILQKDPIQLFLEDNAGRTPLEYIPARLTRRWIAFLDHHKDEFFPAQGPPLAVTKRAFLQLADPPNAISVALARMVSSGQMQPEQVMKLEELTRR